MRRALVAADAASGAARVGWYKARAVQQAERAAARRVRTALRSRGFLTRSGLVALIRILVESGLTKTINRFTELCRKFYHTYLTTGLYNNVLTDWILSHYIY